MSETTPTRASDDATDTASESPTPAPLWVERTGRRTYVGRNARGGSVEIGPEEVDGVISPGELLALALAGCTGMSADSRIASELGDDVAITVGVTRRKVEEENRYSDLVVELVVTAPGQDADRQERMLATARKAVDRLCTVSRTLEAGARVELRLVAEG